ncbi:hypothetical protein [Nostoc sp.]|uniref:hypothetical protein n=1 Tax=Nostoc sp. TaxID=1180 RepID=UPI002FF4CD2B
MYSCDSRSFRLANVLSGLTTAIVDGTYQGQQFRGTERLISQTFPDMNLTAEQIFVVGRYS